MPAAAVNLFFGDSSDSVSKEFFNQACYRTENFLSYSSFISLKASMKQSDKITFCNKKEEKEINLENVNDLKENFRILYNDYYSISNNISIVHFNLLILLGDFSNQDLIFQTFKLLSELIKRDQLKISINLVLIAGDLKNVFDYENSTIKTQANNFKSLQEFIEKQELICKTFLFSNKNVMGRALNLTGNDFARLLCELNIVMIFHHPEIYNSLSTNSLSSLGCSTLYYDSNFLKEYLNSLSYIFLIEKEGIGKDEIIGIKEIAKKAKAILDPYADLFKCFKEKYLLDSDKKIAIIDSNLDKYSILLLNEIQEKLLAFIHSDQFSIYRKRAVLAYLIGEDDDLLEGYNQSNDQSFIKRITLDDCEDSVARFFFDLIEKGEDWINLNDIKDNRQKIQESKSYIKKLTSEIKSLSANIDNLQSNTKVVNENANDRPKQKAYAFDPVIFSTKKLEKNYEKLLPSLASSIDLRSGFFNDENYEPNIIQDVISIISVYDYFFNKSDKKIRFSPQYLNNIIKSVKGNDIQQDYVDVINYLSQFGICQKSTVTKTEDINSEAEQEALQFTLQTALNVEPNENHIKTALNEGYPIIINLKVFKSLENLANNKTGILSYPTPDELKDETYLSHTFILCGYSEEEKYFIAKLSWGNKFANNGYCFIPFGYVLNAGFFRYAYLLTEINGLNSSLNLISITDKNKIIFNVNDSEIRSAFLKNKLTSEGYNLKSLERNYKIKRTTYEHQVVAIGDPKMRELLTDNEVAKINARRNECQNKINDAKLQIEENENRIKKYRIFQGGTILGLALALLYYFLNNKEGLTYTLIIVFLIGLLYYTLKIVRLKGLIKDIKESISRLETEIANLIIEIEKFRLKSKICASLLDDFIQFKARIIKKYGQFRDLIINMEFWHVSEIEQVKSTKRNRTGPFFPIIEPAVLNDFFNKKKSDLLDQVYLTKSFKLDSQNVLKNEDIIREFKVDINETLSEKLINGILNDFNVVDYFSKIRKYEYLPDPSELASFEDIQRCAIPFIQLDNGIIQKEEYFWFILFDNNNVAIKDFIQSGFNPQPLIITSDKSVHQLTFIHAVNNLKESHINVFEKELKN